MHIPFVRAARRERSQLRGTGHIGDGIARLGGSGFMAQLRGRLRGGTVRRAAWMLYAQAGGLVLQGIYFLLLARFLGPAGLGTFVGALAIVSIVAPFSGVGRPNILMMHVS